MDADKTTLTADQIHELAEIPEVVAARQEATRHRLIPRSPPIPGKLDPGIRRPVETLQANGVETVESCEGGPGHAYPEPTVKFRGSMAAGWHALSVCLDNGLPVACLRRVWDVLDGHAPTGPCWEVTFRERVF